MTGASRMPLSGAAAAGPCPLGGPLGGPLGAPSPGQGQSPGPGLVGKGLGLGSASPTTPAGASASPPPAPVRSTATFQRQPRKLRPAPPPPTSPPTSPHQAPVGLGGPGASVASTPSSTPASTPSSTPPSTPRRLRPAPPPPSPAGGDVLGLSEQPRRPPSPSRSPARPPPTQSAANSNFLRVPPALGVEPSGGVRAPTRAPPRHTTTMAIQPTPPYASLPPRPFTSVNLTLRPPAADQAPVDIHSAGSSLTYSTSSYDPRQGYQSQLQICIGPGGVNSVSAIRTRAPAPPAPAPRPPPRPRLMSPVAEAERTEPRTAKSKEELERAVIAMGGADLSPEMREHLVRQLERRTLLETELERERTKLNVMQREVAELERDLERRTAQARPRCPPALPVMEKVQRLRTEIQSLQEECTRMASEVEARAPDTRPEESSWSCPTCTFQNHYLLEACETCDVPRIRLGSDAGRVGRNSPQPMHAMCLPGFPSSSVLPSLATPALDAALAPLSLTTTSNAVCVPNLLTPSSRDEN